MQKLREETQVDRTSLEARLGDMDAAQHRLALRMEQRMTEIETRVILEASETRQCLLWCVLVVVLLLESAVMAWAAKHLFA